MAWWALVIGTVAYLLVIFLRVQHQHVSVLTRVDLGACLCLLFVLQLLHSLPGARHVPVRRKALTLTAQAALVYVPFFLDLPEWSLTAGLLAGSLLNTLPSGSRWKLCGLTVLSVYVQLALTGQSQLLCSFLSESDLLVGLAVGALTWLSSPPPEAGSAAGGGTRTEVARAEAARAEAARAEVTRAEAAREETTRVEITRAAVIGERMRIARDLHDVLGYSMSAITLKAELAQRLIPQAPQQARQELSCLLSLSRQTLYDLRRLAGGLRQLSLVQEASGVQSLLSADGIDADVRVDVPALPPRVEGAMVAVLREAVTNVLSHSGARRCEIRAGVIDGRIHLSVANDGVGTSGPVAVPGQGSGLENLRARLREVGGSLAAAPCGEGRFRLEAGAPVSGSWTGSGAVAAAPGRTDPALG